MCTALSNDVARKQRSLSIGGTVTPLIVPTLWIAQNRTFCCGSHQVLIGQLRVVAFIRAQGTLFTNPQTPRTLIDRTARLSLQDVTWRSNGLSRCSGGVNRRSQSPLLVNSGAG